MAYKEYEQLPVNMSLMSSGDELFWVGQLNFYSTVTHPAVSPGEHVYNVHRYAATGMCKNEV